MEEDMQLINELKATGLEHGLLVNFDALRLRFKRLVLRFFRESA
jgi:hypothetical protein